MWSSIVFHCGSTDTRLLCAQLSKTDTTACSSAFATFKSATSPTISPTPTPSDVPSVSVSPTKTPTTSGSSSTKFCATFSNSQASGATGYFAMEIIDGYARYSYNLNLTSFTLASTCSLSSGGLKYHIHSYWTNTSVSSAAGPTSCGSSYLGGHYDPNYACSASSQQITSGCVNLGRTSSQGYTYSCNTTSYNEGYYSNW